MNNNLLEINVFDYGAKGDSTLDGTGAGTDDTVAIQKAMLAWQNSKGGILKFPPFRPNGKPAAYKISSALSFDVGSGGSDLDFTVDAQGAAFWISVPAGPYDAFTMTNANRLTWLGGTFFGWDGAMPVGGHVPNPIHSVFNCSVLRMHDAHFIAFVLNDFGDENTAIIKCHNLVLKNCTFESIANTAGKPTVLLPSGWALCDLQDLSFTDFIIYKNQSGSIGQGAGLPILIKRPSVESGHSVYGPNQVILRGLHCDEGSGQIRIGDNCNTTLDANFTQPNSYYDGIGGYTVTIQVGDNSLMRQSDILYIPGGGYYQVQSKDVDGIHVTVLNIGINAEGTNAAPTTVVSSVGNPRISWGYIENVVIEGCNMNVVPSNNTIGIDLKNIHHVKITDLWIREGGNGSVCVKGRYVDSISIERTSTITTNAPLSSVDFDSTVGSVRFIDSHMNPSGSSAVRTTIANAPYNLSKGANVAAANDLQLAYGSSMTVITGNTTINAIKANTLEVGKEFFLLFTGTPLIKNDTAGGAGTAKMILNSSMDIQPIAPGFKLGLMYNGSDIHETTRKAS